MKRLRKRAAQYSGANKIKFYACGEYGSENHRPHYHAIIYNLPDDYARNNDPITQIWNKGQTDLVPGNERTMAYVSKYINKKSTDKQIIDTDTGEIIDDDRIPEFSLMSKKLGSNFLTKAMIKYLKENLTGHVMVNGYPTPVPRYYKDKLYTPYEKVILAKAFELARQERLDKNFNDDPHLEGEWKKSQIRKHIKMLKEQRNTL